MEPECQKRQRVLKKRDLTAKLRLQAPKRLVDSSQYTVTTSHGHDHEAMHYNRLTI